MAENEIKQVHVTLSHSDELNPRKRRRTRKTKDAMESSIQSGGGVVGDIVEPTAEPPIVVQKEVPIVQPIQTTPPPPPVPSIASTAVVGGGIGSVGPKAVHIREKKNIVGTQDAGSTASGSSSTAAPKIIPHKKRLTAAPMAQTVKKPKLIIGGGEAEKNNPINTTTNDPWGTRGGGVKDGERGPIRPKVRRKFTERKIKIEVKPSSKTRKSRSFIKERINSMPIQNVRKILIQKGLLKAKSTVPPEPMMRSMLNDYYMLKESD
jgi:hypothetical protein